MDFMTLVFARSWLSVVGRRQFLLVEEEVLQVIDLLDEVVVLPALRQVVVLQVLQVLHHMFLSFSERDMAREVVVLKPVPIVLTHERDVSLWGT